LRELGIGIVLGLAAGLTPGPLLALVLAASIERGFAAGARVAAAPLLSDAPVVVLCVLVLDELPDAVVSALAIGGGVFVVGLGVQALRDAGRPAPAAAAAHREVGRAVLINLANPHPWLFWISVGGPLLLRAADDSVAAAVAFLAGFYGLLVGTKVVLAAGVAAGRKRLLAGRGYALALRVAALLLVGAGVVLVIEGIRSPA
jgi:threonine/homoserine/homoserine lactone efflux protein